VNIRKERLDKGDRQTQIKKERTIYLSISQIIEQKKMPIYPDGNLDLSLIQTQWLVL
jgi:hypothetical protein